MLFELLFDLLFVLSVSSSSWCLGWAAVCDCGTPWAFLLPFLTSHRTLVVYVLISVLYVLHFVLFYVNVNM